mgnify:CR=1 FL=1
MNAQRRSSSMGPSIWRHCAVVALAAVLAVAFWLSRMDWTPDMRLWRAVGDAAALLLFTALAIGPAAKLWSSAGWLLRWRRAIGVWAGLVATVHALLVIDGWAQWSLRRFLGYEFVPQLAREARMEPGFGLANLIGLVALVWMLVLVATSSDRALRFLGPPAWKWIHNGAYVVLYLVVLHASYYLFIHYTVSFHRLPAPENWFRIPFLILGGAVIALQWAAFTRGVRRRRAHGHSGREGALSR